MNYASQVVTLLDWQVHDNPARLRERAAALRAALLADGIKFNVREHWDLLQLIEGRLLIQSEYAASEGAATTDKAA